MTPTANRLFLLAILWSVSLVRLRTLRHGTEGQRRIWAAFTLVAIALTVHLPSVAEAISQAAHSANIDVLVMHLCGLGACYELMCWLDGLTRSDATPRAWRTLVQPRPRRYALALALAASIATFPWLQQASYNNFNQMQSGQPVGALHVGVFEMYLGWAMLLTGLICADAWRLDRSRLVGRCMGIMAIGCWLGAVYAALQGILLLPLPDSLTHPIAVFTSYVVDASILLITIGSSVRAFLYARSAWTQHRHVTALRPLWEQVNPHLDKRMVAATPSRLREVIDPRRARKRLNDRWLEIWDAALILEGWVPAGLRDDAADAAAWLGVPEDERAAAVEAYCLRVALRQAQDPTSERSQGGRPPISPHDDLFEGVRWLEEVSQAYFGPRMDDLDDTLRAKGVTA